MRNTPSSANNSTDTTFTNEITFILNGEVQTVGSEVSPETTLNEYIRQTAHLTGTKNLCYEGDCGACIVAATIMHPILQKKQTLAVNSCLVPVLSCHNWEITTVEGLGDRHSNYHMIQATLAHFNGTQCGFCSPGMVMNMYSLSKDKTPTMAEVENAFGGNLCRCTGYRSILDAFKSLASDASPTLQQACTDIEDVYKICPKTNRTCSGNCKTIDLKSIHLKVNTDSSWYKVNTLNELLTILNNIGDVNYKLVAGNTAEGLYPNNDIQVYIDIKDVTELRSSVTTPTYKLGANMTLVETIELFKSATEPDYVYLHQIANHIDKIANVAINNIGTLAGNLTLKKEHPEFVSDIYVIFETVGVTLDIVDAVSGNTTTGVLLADYLNMDTKKKVLVNINLPLLNDSYRLKTFKVMQRAQGTKAYVSAGFLVQIQDTTSWTVIGQPRIVYGGISRTFNRANNTETYLIGKNLLEASTVAGVQLVLGEEIIPEYVPPGAVPEYLRPLAQALFYKFLLGLDPSKVSEQNRSGSENLERPLSSGLQDYQTDPSVWPLNQPIPKLEALTQCSGEAQYVNDIALKHGELQAAFVVTKVATGIITAIDPSPALAMPGVHGFFRDTDIPGSNTFTPSDFNFPENEEIFCTGTVKYAGEVVGIVVAETRKQAMAAAEAVIVTYENVTKPILCIDDAVKTMQTDQKQEETLQKTSVKATNTINGRFEIGKQFHLTLEPQTCLVEPTEDGFDVFSSTQWMDLTQTTVARTLHIPINQVTVYVRRLGGGFGGKQSRSALVACACAVAAQKLKRPVRMVMTLPANMEVMGKRFAQRHDYTVNFDDTGKIESVSSYTTQDSGCYFNESPLSLVFYFFISCYDTTNYVFGGHEVRTNTASNTPTRGPGPIEGIAFHDELLERVAKYLKKDPLEVKLINMHTVDNPLPDMIKELKEQANYDERKRLVDLFNANNRWKKQGMAIMPMRYPQSIWANYNSLVSIYHGDGTVCVTHGGIEMGQGVNTKIAQVAAYTLQIPLSKIRIAPSNTVSSANANVSGGSIVSEGASHATMMACQELLRRLEPVRESMGNPTWEQLVHQAYLENIDLQATYMFSKKDNLKDYAIWGVSIAQVEVDILTGEKQVLRVDLVEDVGKSLSPMIDVGQIEGAFVMGMGYWLSEEIKHDVNTGRLLNRNLSTYKAPGPKDIPARFEIHFRENSNNEFGVFGSKTTGEPAICMSVVTWFAIRNALDSARKDAGGVDEYFDMKFPASNENIYLATLTDPSQFVL